MYDYGEPASSFVPWPFGGDADRGDPLTAHRIAATGSYPRWSYLLAFDRRESRADLDDREVALLAAHLQFWKDTRYHQRYVQHMAQRLLDVDGGANGLIFRKWGTDDWCYRRRTHTGFYPNTWPEYRRPGARVWPLDELLLHIRTYSSALPDKPWKAWLRGRPDAALLHTRTRTRRHPK